LALLFVAAAPAEIYKWVDAQGNVHYGDEPGPGARPVRDLPELSTYAPRPLPEAVIEEEQQPPDAAAGEEAAHPGYRMLRIISPEPEATVRSAPGDVSIFVALDPTLREGDHLKVILDGKLLPERYGSTVIQLKNVDRGAHQVAVAVYDETGRKLKESEHHVFYLHRTIAKPRKSPRGG